VLGPGYSEIARGRVIAAPVPGSKVAVAALSAKKAQPTAGDLLVVR